MLLRIEHLHKHYGGVQALDNISLSLETGQVLGLVGDNGAGKSTLMKCITGAEKPDKGLITLGDRKLDNGNPHTSRAAGIEMIYQDLNLCAQQDVTSNIFLGREKLLTLGHLKTPFIDKRGMEKMARELLGRFNCYIDIRKNAGILSGGQQQAVAIARTLLNQPRLLIMDEPTASLGVRETANVLSLIQSLKSQGIAVILISHRLTDIFEVADRVVLMRHGRIEEDSMIDQTSLSDFTHKLLAS